MGNIKGQRHIEDPIAGKTDFSGTVTRFYDRLTSLQNNKVDFGFTNC